MLDLTHCDELSLSELREYRRVKILENGEVAVETKKGEWVSNPVYGLQSLVKQSLVQANKPGVYAIPSPEEWAKEAAIRATPNPWKRESFNLTRQLMLQDQDPEVTARFKREAGVQ